jgi:hypothetical protein
MRVLPSSVRLLGWGWCLLGCWACGTETNDDFPSLTRGVVEGVVRGSNDQPLDSVNVVLVIPEALDQQFTFGAPSVVTDSDGSFSIAVEILDRAEPTAPLPVSVEIYVGATALPEKYPPPSGEESIVDSVLVDVSLVENGQGPAPTTTTAIELPIP